MKLINLLAKLFTRKWRSPLLVKDEPKLKFKLRG